MLELPLQEIRAGRTVTRIERRGISFLTDAYIVDDHLIWGATARIIEHLLAAPRQGRTGPATCSRPDVRARAAAADAAG